MIIEFLKRLWVAAILIIIALGSSYFGGWVFALLIAVMCAVSIYEIHQIMEILDFKGLRIPSSAFGFIALMIIHFFGVSAIFPLFLTFVIIVSVTAVFMGVDKGFKILISSVVANILVCFPMAAMILIRDGNNWPSDLTAAWIIIYIWAGIWWGDTAAYLIGRQFGKIKLAPRLSPKKTVEGAIAGVVTSILWCYVGSLVAIKSIGLTPLNGFFSNVQILYIGVIIGAFSITGDLTMSLFKRAAEVKDSGKLFPGHGGALDRFDSMIFVSGAIYLYFIISGFVHFP
ncbi:MAG: phosphatidate cytidylyltransferase [Candidatus Electryonea clarkiae]|nr:phosphatidate cytidylyltransferase [Candidatus Electryonea clarkiae]MDP8285095.1 phosphatidate cytidylyltransferase [Candidatus Electryonea clarkiae]